MTDIIITRGNAKIDISKSDINNPFYEFENLLLYLDFDFNYKMNSVCDYLYDINSDDYKILYEKIKQHENWEYVELLNNFDYKKFVDNYISNFSLIELIKITNDIIKKFENKDIYYITKKLTFIEKYINNLDELYIFYENFSKNFKKVSENYIEKYKHNINEIIEEKKGNRSYKSSWRKVGENYLEEPTDLKKYIKNNEKI